jgi:glycosyltransferase involved in cell wall biosynthesis
LKILIIENTGEDFYKSRLRLAIFFKEKGHDVYAGVPDDGYTTKIQDRGIEVICLGEIIRGRGLKNVLGLAFKLLKVFQRNEFDVIHCYRMQPNIVGCSIASVTTNAKLFGTITGLGYVFTVQSIKNTLQSKIVLLFYFLLDRFTPTILITQNQEDAKTLKLKNNCVIKGSSADESIFKPIKNKRTKRVNNSFSILFASRLLNSKGIKTLIKSIEIINYDNSGIKFNLIVAGEIDKDNPDSISLGELEELKKIKNTYFIGKSKNIYKQIVESDLCVLPTTYKEGTPRFLLEAMACSKPIITTNAPGCDHLVLNGKNGYICKKNDPKHLAQQIKKALNLDLYSAGEISRQHYLRNFSENVIFNSILKLYEQ